MSDASIAEPEPTPPIDIPTSALASTGESFIPSPTNATLPFVPLYFSNSFSSSNPISFIFCEFLSGLIERVVQK